MQHIGSELKNTPKNIEHYLALGAKFANRRLQNFALTTLIFFSVAGLTAIYLSLNHGIDWTDEAWGWSLGISNFTSSVEPWTFQHLLHIVLLKTEYAILPIRYVRLFGYMLSGILLSGSLLFLYRKRLQNRRESYVIVILFSQLGTFIAFSFPYRGVFYNEMTAWLVCLISSLCILILGLHLKTKPWIVNIILGLVGVCISMLILTKFTAFPLFLVAAIAFISLCGHRKASNFGSFISGGIFCFIILDSLGIQVASSLTTLINFFWKASARSSFSGHPVGHLILAHIFYASLDLLAILIVFAVINLLTTESSSRSIKHAFRWRKISTRKQYLRLSIVTLFFPFFQEGGQWRDLGRFIFLVGSIAFCLTIINRRLEDEENHPRELVGIFIIMCFPFLASVGTNNPLPGQLLYVGMPWFAFLGAQLAISSVQNTFESVKKIFVPTIMTCVTIWSSSFLYLDIFVHPFRTEPYFKQQSMIDSGPLKGIMVSSPEKSWINWLAPRAKRLHDSGFRIISLGSPGSNLIAGSDNFASPWLVTRSESSWLSISSSCLISSKKNLRIAVLTSEGFGLSPFRELADEPMLDQFNDVLKGCKLKFPTDFQKIDQYNDLENDYGTSIWVSGPHKF